MKTATKVGSKGLLVTASKIFSASNLVKIPGNIHKLSFIVMPPEIFIAKVV